MCGRMGCRNVLWDRRRARVPASRRFRGWRQQPDSALCVWVRKCAVFGGAAEVHGCEIYRRNGVGRCGAPIREDLRLSKKAVRSPVTNEMRCRATRIQKWDTPPELPCARKPTPNEQWRRYGPQNPNYMHLAVAAACRWCYY